MVSLGVSPSAMAGVANFSVTNNSAQTWNLKCVGPYSRIKGTVVAVGEEDKIWYSPADPIFFTGPYGKWTCGTADPETCATNFDCEDSGCFCCENGFGGPGVKEGPNACLSVTEFCLLKDPDPDVSMAISADGTITTNGAMPPCNDAVLATATLGFEVLSSSTDEDNYEFDGQAGDDVTIRVEVDPDVGRAGERATLSIGKDSSEALTGGMMTDALPLEIQMTLPETGTYWVRLSNLGVDPESRFVGGYVLSVSSAADLVSEIRPRDAYDLWQGRNRPD
jgi:hypothetical protein